MSMTPEEEARIDRLVEAHPLVANARDLLAHFRTMARKVVMEQMSQSEAEELQIAAKEALERAQQGVDKMISDRRRWAQKIVRQCDRLLADAPADEA